MKTNLSLAMQPDVFGNFYVFVDSKEPIQPFKFSLSSSQFSANLKTFLKFFSVSFILEVIYKNFRSLFPIRQMF